MSNNTYQLILYHSIIDEFFQIRQVQDVANINYIPIVIRHILNKFLKVIIHQYSFYIMYNIHPTIMYSKFYKSPNQISFL
jgi:hypothetical protein